MPTPRKTKGKAFREQQGTQPKSRTSKPGKAKHLATGGKRWQGYLIEKQEKEHEAKLGAPTKKTKKKGTGCAGAQ